MNNVEIANMIVNGMSAGKSVATIATEKKIESWRKYEIMGVLRTAGIVRRSGVGEYELKDEREISADEFEIAYRDYKKPKAARPKGPAAKKAKITTTTKKNVPLLDKPLELPTAGKYDWNQAYMNVSLTITGAPGAIAETIKRLTGG